MAHVGSPDTFFTGKAGPYDVRVSVRLPGVIPGRAQVAVRVAGATSPDATGSRSVPASGTSACKARRHPKPLSPSRVIRRSTQPNSGS